MANVKEQKRISQLDKISTEDFNKLIPVDSPTPSEEEIAQAAESENWWLAMDYRKEDDETVPDAGTLRFPISRVALLNEYRVVPSTMLPSYVDEMVPGNMTYDATTGKYTFTANDGTGYVYSCPDSQRAEGEREPRTDLIYLDNEPETSNVQYRYIGGSVQKFQALPNSLLLIDGKGTNVTIGTEAIDATRQIDIDIGAPAAKASGDTNPLQISTGDNKQLYHANSGVIANTYGTTAAATPEFGDTFTSHKITVDSTGHVTAAADFTVKIPDTVASNTVNGLAKTGTTATHIGANSAGSTTGNVYSAYDHVHDVSNLYFGSKNSMLYYKPSDTADKVITAKDLLNTVYGYTVGTTYRAINTSGEVVQTKPTLAINSTTSGTTETYSIINGEIGANADTYSFGHDEVSVALNYCADNTTSMLNIVGSDGKSFTNWYHVKQTSATEVELCPFSSLVYEIVYGYGEEYPDYAKTTQYIGGVNVAQCSTNYSTLTFYSKPVGDSGMWSTHDISFYAAPYTEESQHYTLPKTSPYNDTMVLSAVPDDQYTAAEGGWMTPETTPRYQLKWVELNDINPCQYVYMNSDPTVENAQFIVMDVYPYNQLNILSSFIASDNTCTVQYGTLSMPKFYAGKYRISVSCWISPGDDSYGETYHTIEFYCQTDTDTDTKTLIGMGLIDWTLKGKQHFTASAMVDMTTDALNNFKIYWKIDKGDIPLDCAGTSCGLTNFYLERVK